MSVDRPFGLKPDEEWDAEITVYRHHGFDFILRTDGWDGPVPDDATATYVLVDSIKERIAKTLWTTIADEGGKPNDADIDQLVTEILSGRQ